MARKSLTTVEINVDSNLTVDCNLTTAVGASTVAAGVLLATAVGTAVAPVPTLGTVALGTGVLTVGQWKQLKEHFSSDPVDRAVRDAAAEFKAEAVAS